MSSDETIINEPLDQTKALEGEASSEMLETASDAVETEQPPKSMEVSVVAGSEPVLRAASASAVDEVVPIVAGARAPGSSFKRFGGRSFGNKVGGRHGAGRKPRGQRDIPVESDYEEKNIEIARVTRVTKGGKRMRFRALTVIGNRQGRVGYGLAKGADVAGATAKATSKARKALFTVPMVNETIAHPIEVKFSAAHILLKPAPKGTGVKAGGAVRIVLELAGIPNVVSKILGSKNKINNVKATFVALRRLRLSSPQSAPKQV